MAAKAAAFVKETGIDVLACSFGTTHGIYLTEPCLDFDVIKRRNKVMGFRKDFLWGAASASHQIEGAAKEGGKGEDLWEHFERGE